MIPPKIDICIEGYNIEQTDFYIAHIIDKYNSLNELYQKSCEHIVFLEKECKNGFYSALLESEKRILDKIESFENRLSALENNNSINNDIKTNKESSDSEAKDDSIHDEERFKAELSDFHSELEGLKSIFSK